MKIGYPCINRTVPCSASGTFRLASYSDNRLRQTVENNLDCLFDILKYNVSHNILFFRISSDLIPFASHPVCTFAWAKHFSEKFAEIGNYISKYHIRISMHPDQFTVINSPKKDVVRRSIEELRYHAQVLDLLRTDTTAKIQIHIGGAYGDKSTAKNNFVETISVLDIKIRRRLVIENDHTTYSVRDCLDISKKTGVPVLFDSFHDSINGCGIGIAAILGSVRKTWQSGDGIPMMDYSTQEKGKRCGAHAETLEPKDFNRFLKDTKSYDFDLMLEIKDKEKSAILAQFALRNDPRFVTIA